MSSNRAKNTKPELIVRKYLWKNGFKGYRIHPKNIPGKPDIAFIGKKISIFINGCFWHGHNKCRDGHIPKSNKDYWKKKIKRNIERDRLNYKKLDDKGWKVITLWECNIKKSNNPIDFHI